MLIIYDGNWYRFVRFGEIAEGDSYISITDNNELDGVRTVTGDIDYNPGGFCGAIIVEEIGNHAE